MANFENSSLWQSSLAKQLSDDIYEKEREFFRVNFESLRENAGLLSAEIARDLPDFTVHDLTHLDALWEIGSLICGDDFHLNPAEAFVLGGAFLIHDLGMGLAAYPEGVNELKKTKLWEDTLSSLSRTSAKDPSEIEKDATNIVLRALHAKHAEKLALISWGDKEKLYLINNPELRSSYGTIIGMIAHSHWWSSDELIKRLPKSLGAFEKMPNDWGIDPIKLACIMRVADAAHIDTRRAPLLLKAVRQPNDYASQHWLFQQRLYQPRLESEYLVYTSKSSFSTEEFNSWWLCFDTLKMIDRELRDVDSILSDTVRPRLKAKGVAAINNIHLLTKLIGTDGWKPIDTKIRVGNVAKLVKNLGGEQLYGKDLLVPLRELIQNACDAIRARRLLEDEDNDWGKVIVRSGKDSLGQYIEVEDNGVGMSVNVLSGPFLDFGSSFWGSNMMHEELPGLDSKGFTSTGKFGVGFFSAFMWGEKIKVTTRRYEDARQDTKVLEFQDGLSRRPLLRDAKEEEYIRNGGTKIRVYFSDSKDYQKLFSNSLDKKIELSDIIEELCPTVNVTIACEDAHSEKIVIKANDWLTLSGDDFIKRAMGLKKYTDLSDDERNQLNILSKNIKNICSNEKVIGRGFIASLEDSQRRFWDRAVKGTVTVGGFKASKMTGILGLFIGKEARASRDIGIPYAEGKILQEWATEQAELLKEQFSNPELQVGVSRCIRVLGGDTKDLVIAECKVGYINKVDFLEKIKDKHKEIIIISNSGFSLLKRDYGDIELLDNVFVVDPGISPIISFYQWIDWPDHSQDRFHAFSLQGILEETFADMWNISLETLFEISDISTDDKHYTRVIGHTLDGTEVIDDFVDILRVQP